MITVGAELVLVLAIAARAAGGELSCPEIIQVTGALAIPVEGWTEGRADEPHRLAGVTMFDGKPEERASLVGTERIISKTQTGTTWNFAKGRQYWLTCSYAGTGVVLSTAIPGTIGSCTVTYARNVRVSGLPEIQRIDCK